MLGAIRKGRFKRLLHGHSGALSIFDLHFSFRLVLYDLQKAEKKRRLSRPLSLSKLSARSSCPVDTQTHDLLLNTLARYLVNVLAGLDMLPS